MSSDLFKDVINKLGLQIINMYKEDLALNILQWLICYKSPSNQITMKYICVYKEREGKRE